MSVDISEFWKLALESQLFSAAQQRQLAEDFSQVKGAAQQGNARTLSEWLIAQNAITRYHASVLLGGSPGLFFYGEYRIDDRIRRGPQQGWFRGCHLQTKCPVLLQFLTGELTSHPSLWAAAVQRAETQSRIVHPQLTRSFELVDLGSHKFLVHQAIAGQSIASHLQTSGPAPPAEASRLIRLAALALDHLHQSGEVATHLNLHHLWLEPGGNLRLLRDPLLAPIGWQGWNAEMVASYADYAAPEFQNPQQLPDRLTDLYALGCIFYELLTGRPPFGEGIPQAKLACHATEAISPLEPLGVPAAMAQVVVYLMAKDRSIRIQRGAQVAEQLLPMIDPARADLPPDPELPQLASYQQWVQQKQAALQASRKNSNDLEESGAGDRRLPGGDLASPPSLPTGVPQHPANLSPTLQVTTESSTTSILERRSGSHHRKEASQKNWWIGGGIGLVVLGIAIAFIFQSGSPRPSEELPVADDQQQQPSELHSFTPDYPEGSWDLAGAVESGTAENDQAVAPTSWQSIVPDDGQKLWASPTEGQPISLRMIPPGAQLLLSLRPAAMSSTVEGSRVLAALEPQIGTSRDRWEQAAGLPWAEIDQMLIAFYPVTGGIPRVCVVVRLAGEQPSPAALWPGAQIVAVAGQTVYQANSWGYFVDPDIEQRSFLMGAIDQVEEVASVAGGPPLLRRELAELLRYSDADRHCTLLLAPSFLFSDGRKLLEGSVREKLLDPLSWFLGDTTKGALVSLNFGDDQMYAEARFISSLDTPPIELARQFRERMTEMPQQVERYVSSLTLVPYSRMLLQRYPQMLYRMAQMTRIGSLGNQAVLTCRLESKAAHNLAIATEQALVLTPGSPISSAPPSETRIPQTVEEVLTHQLSMSFSQTSLEFAMRDLAELVTSDLKNLPFPFQIKIIGTDLQLNGITRNQQILNFDESDQSVSKILTSLVMRANPVTTVQSPDEADQKLVWVVAPDPDDPTQPIVLITTRDAANQKGYTLPSVFQGD